MKSKHVIRILLIACVTFYGGVPSAFGQLLDADAAKRQAQDSMLDFLLLQSKRQQRFACVVVSDQTSHRNDGSIFIATGKTLIAADEKKGFLRHDIEIVPIAATSDLPPILFQWMRKDGKLHISTSRDQVSWLSPDTYAKDQTIPRPQYPIIDPLALTVCCADAFAANQLGSDSATKCYTSLRLVTAKQNGDILSSLWKPKGQAQEELRPGDLEHVVEFSSKQSSLPVKVLFNAGIPKKDGTVLRVPITVTQTVWVESAGQYLPKRVTHSGRDLGNTKTFERVFEIHWLDDKLVDKFMQQESLKLVGGGLFKDY